MKQGLRSPLSGLITPFGRTQGGAATLTIESVGTQDGAGDVPITYLIDRTSLVSFWLYPAAEADPTTVAELSSAPFVAQGPALLTVGGGSINLDIVGALTGSVKGVALVSGGGDSDLVTFGPFTLAGGLELLTQQATASGFGTIKDFTVTGTAGETVALVIALTSANANTGVVIDPGGGNEIAATVRTSGGSSGAYFVLADVVWPATGALTVRTTWASSINPICITAISVGSKTHQVSNNAASGNEADPETHSQTVNTTAGQSVIFSVTLDSTSAMTLAAGADTILGVEQALGTRRNWVAKKDAAAGGTPETFTMQWAGVSNKPSHGVLGVYA